MEAQHLVREAAPRAEMVRAAADLLLDPNPRVHSVCEERLLAWGEASRPALEALYEVQQPAARRRVRRVLRNLDVRAWVDAFGGFAAEPTTDLETGLLLVSRLPRPMLDVDKLKSQLDEWADMLAARLSGLGARNSVAAIGDFFHGELGFRGDPRNYYEVANSLIDQVVSRRRGIPLTLSVVIMLVGRRLGLPLEGVGLPGHFILRWRGARSVLFDPFHGGKVMTQSDCVERVRALGYAFDSAALEPVSDRGILVRSLSNLLHTLGFVEDRLLITAVQQARRQLAAGRPERAG
jgi:regulator of sirC expression with transglutaminase-like and TPR domain